MFTKDECTLDDSFFAEIAEYNLPNDIQVLKDEIIGEERYLSIEQALITTAVYKRNENKPRVLQKAMALRKVMEEIEITIDPKELIVGNRTAQIRAGVVSVEAGLSWVVEEIDTLSTRIQDRFMVKPEDKELFLSEIVPYWQGKSLEDVLESEIGEVEKSIHTIAKINQMDHAQGHINPHVEKWLAKGPSGILAEIRKAKEGCSEDKKDFYDASIEVYLGALTFIERYQKLALEMLSESPNKINLKEIADNCAAILEGKITTFAQAVQATWFLFALLHLESNASSFAPGRLDQYLYPYYLNSISQGMSNIKALELLSGFWLKCNQIVYMRNKESANYFAGFPTGFNIALSGKNENDVDQTNELSYLCLKVQKLLGLPQPNLSVRLHYNTPERFLHEVATVIGTGGGMPQVFNDESIIPALINKGILKEDAYNYCIVGCVELTTSGNDLGWCDAAMFNMLKVLELTLNNGICLLTNKELGLDLGNLTTYKTFEELEEAYAKQTSYFIDKMISCCEVVDQKHGEIIPSPFLSGVIDDCINKGTDVTLGGAKYNLSGIQAIQVANLADSFAVIKQLVFDEKSLSATELLENLRDDYENEITRQIVLNKVCKYGNDIEWVDMLGQKWIMYFANELTKYTNVRGGIYHAGMYTVSAHIPMGHNVGASCDGRHAQDPLADGGLSAVYGRDVSGPTALLKSVSRIDSNLGSNGTLLNMKFLPTTFKNEESFRKFVSLLKTIVKLKINHTQFNVVNKEDLLAAKKNPDQFRSMTIRVAGYTAYFVELAPDLQDEIIARTQYEV